MSFIFSERIGFIRNAVDSFNRLRISSPHTLFDSQNRYQDNGKFDTLLSGSGASTHSANESCINLSTTGTGAVVRQSFKNFPYQPGKSLFVVNSFVFGNDASNVTQRVGFFDDQNGIFLQLKDGTLSVVLRSYVTGSVVDTVISRSSWNGDLCNGYGKSGFNLDLTKANIFWIDIEWLGVGNVRCGFFYEGEPVLAHTIKNTNALTTTYMTTACLPIRYEITNTTSSYPSTLKQICSSVISEGGYELSSSRYSITRGTTTASAQNLSNAGTFYPTVSIRLNSSRIKTIVFVSQIDVLTLSNANVHWKLMLNSTLTGSSFVTHSRGNVDYDISATSLSGGSELANGFGNDNNIISLGENSRWYYQLGKTIGGTSDIITLAISPYSNNANVSSGLSWEEVL